MKQVPAARRGFTLVEVLVALMIMAVLATMAWQGIDGIVRTRDISQAQVERSLQLNTVIAQWDRDLAVMIDTAVVPALAFDGATLRLSRQAEGGVQVVAWSLRGTQLQRWAGPVVTSAAELQDSWMRSQQLLGNEVGSLLLLDAVSAVQVEFFRGNSWTNAQSSGDLQPASPGGAPQREQPPTGLRLVLSFDEQRLVRDLMLPPQMP